MKQYAEFLGNYLHHMYFQMCSTKHLLEIKSNLAFLIQLETFGSLIKQKCGSVVYHTVIMNTLFL